MYNIRRLRSTTSGPRAMSGSASTPLDTPAMSRPWVATRLLEAIRRSNNNVKFYQASSSEMFGAAHPPQGEDTLFHPLSPYACAKVYWYWMTRNYREGIISLRPTESSSTTSHRAGAKPLLPAKSPVRSPASVPGRKNISISATSMPEGTGDMPRSTSSVCGGFSSRKSPGTS